MIKISQGGLTAHDDNDSRHYDDDNKNDENLTRWPLCT